MLFHFEIVPVGEHRISKEKGKRLFTITASCVALVLYDSKSHIAGILHVVLPKRKLKEHRHRQKSYFANTGVPIIIEQMLENGACIEHLNAVLVGGGSSLLKNGSGLDIGNENVEMVKTLLQKYGISIAKMYIGGNIGRSVSIDVLTGKIDVKFIYQPNEDVNVNKFLKQPIEKLINQLETFRPSVINAGNLLKEIHKQPIAWEKVDSIIFHDFILAMHIFRIANSPYYGSPGMVGSLKAARALLGPVQFRRICVLCASMKQSTPSSNDFGFSEKLLSDHCMATAMISKHLTSGKPINFQEEVFTSALLHGINCLCMIMLGPGQDFKNCFSQDKVYTNKLVCCLGYRKIGKAVLQKWRFPSKIINGVTGYKDFENIKNSNKIEIKNSYSVFVNIACILSRLLGIHKVSSMMLDIADYNSIYNLLDQLIPDSQKQQFDLNGFYKNELNSLIEFYHNNNLN